MEVTNVKFYNIAGNTSMKAFADVEFDGEFWVKGFKVFESRNGTFVRMPQEKAKDGEYYDRCRFSDKKWYEQGNTHPIMTEIARRWKTNSNGTTQQKKENHQQHDSDPW